MFEFLKDIGNYETRCVGRTEVSGLTVSTAFTSDERYETAIIDENQVHPVERYSTKEDAEKGHEKWCREAETITTVKKLGWLGIVGDSEIVLERAK